MELELYTGNLMYKGISFSFSFFEDELRLIPSSDKMEEIQKWGLYELCEGCYINGDPVQIEDKYLIGEINETGNKIVFFPDSQFVGQYNEVLRVGISKYIILQNSNYISGLDFYSKEIDLIFPPSNTFHGYEKNKETGEIVIHTKEYNTCEDTIKFTYKGVDISLCFYCIRKVNMFGGEKPIVINSLLSLSFKDTDDYSFIIDLYNIVEKLLKFMFNNKTVSSQKCIINSLDENIRSSTKNGELFSLDSQNNLLDEAVINKKKCIKYDYLKSAFSDIMQDIADDNFYLGHIPKDYEDSRVITPDRFVMIVAGFENLFRLLYPQGVVHSDSTTTKNKKFTDLVNNFMETSDLNSDMRRKFKRIIDEINRDSVEDRLLYVYKCNKDLLDFFAKSFFQMNKVTFDFNKVANNVQKYRNLFAHGGVFDDYDINALLGLVLLERINYIMHLKYYKVSDELIKKSINDLFHCGLIVE